MTRKIAVAAVLWVALAAIAWATLWRRVPESAVEWLLLVAVGPIAYLLASALGEGMFELYRRLPGVRHIHAFAEARTSGREFSWLRVGVYLATSLFLLGIMFSIAWMFRLP